MSEKLRFQFKTIEDAIMFFRNSLNYLSNIKKKDLCLREFNIGIEANIKIYDNIGDENFVPKLLKIKWEKE